MLFLLLLLGICKVSRIVRQIMFTIKLACNFHIDTPQINGW